MADPVDELERGPSAPTPYVGRGQPVTPRLAIITPTRGRPERFARMVAAVRALAGEPVEVIGCVDDDDDSCSAYSAIQDVSFMVGPRRSLSGWTNTAAEHALSRPISPRYLASLGDDHIPRSAGFAGALIESIEAMDGPGFAYGNDLYQGAALSTAWVVSAEVVRALGWMMLPTCEHMFVDTAVRDLGQRAGRIAYVPDVVIEHVHPLAGKAGWDASYRASNSRWRWAADEAAYRAWLADGLERDVATVRALGPKLDREVSDAVQRDRAE